MEIEGINGEKLQFVFNSKGELFRIGDTFQGYSVGHHFKDQVLQKIENGIITGKPTGTEFAPENIYKPDEILPPGVFDKDFKQIGPNKGINKEILVNIFFLIIIVLFFIIINFVI